MKRILISSKDLGIFLGTCIGLAFWSKMDTVGQSCAITFPTLEAATKFADHLKDVSIDSLTFTEVETTLGNFASIEDCVKAGFSGWKP